MDERDFERLEGELRSVVDRGQPEPPVSLVQFARDVPAMTHRPGLAARLSKGRLIRGGFLAAAAAVVAVVALAGSQVLMSVRQSQTPGAAAAAISFDGWSWQQLPGQNADHGAAWKVARGYVATCHQDTTAEAVCTSTDGATWTTPADPAIAIASGSDPFRPNLIVHYQGVSLAASSVSTDSGAPASWPSLWRSTDDLHWTQVSWPVMKDMSFQLMPTTLANGFVVEAGPSGLAPASEHELLFVSGDGSSWTRAGDLPVDVEVAMMLQPAPSGVYVSGPGGGKIGTWLTTDGSTWVKASLPAGTNAVSSVVGRPGGGYLAVGGLLESPNSSSLSVTSTTLVTSTDGVTWQALPSGLVGSIDQVAAVADRFVVAVSAPEKPNDPQQIWQSFDAGGNWVGLLDPTGHPVVGSFSGDQNSLTLGENSREWTLTPVARDAAATPPLRSMPAPLASSPAASIESSPTRAAATPTIASRPLPSALTGEWTWRQTDGTYFEAPFAVPGGFVATCGDPGDHELANASLCSSTDGLNWTVPADPAMVSVAGQAAFWPVDVVNHGGSRVALAMQKPLPFAEAPSGSIWSSADGVHWSPVASSAFGDLKPSALETTPTGFLVVALDASNKRGGVFTSSDGATWARATDLPVSLDSFADGDPGLYVVGRTPAGEPQVWRTMDGASWTRGSLPDGIASLSSPARTADGGLVAMAVGDAGPASNVVLGSTDGLHWQAVATNLDGNLFSLTAAGSRLIATVSMGGAYDGPYLVWQSADGGKTWQPMPGPDGLQLTTIASGHSGTVRVTDATGKVTWVGTLANP